MLQNKEKYPIYVDLDGTLALNDQVWESVIQFLKRYPYKFFLLFWWLYHGRPTLKKNLTKVTSFDPSSLPYNHELISFLKDQKKKGVELYLITGAPQPYADQVANQLGFFKAAYGTRDDVNLVAENKVNVIQQHLSKGAKFIYAGNSRQDIPVWKASHGIIAVNPPSSVKNWILNSKKPYYIYDSKISFVKETLKIMSVSKEKIYLSLCQGSEVLGQELANFLGIPIAPRNFEEFSSGEILVDLIEDPTAKDVYILSTPLYPGVDGYMELFLMMDAAKRHGAQKIIPIIPYFGYGRQNRCFKPYSPMPCETLAKLLKAAGATDLITVDLHDPGVLDFFSFNVVHLSCNSLIAHDISNRFGTGVVIVSPDAGGVERAQEVADVLQAPMAMIQKKRVNPHEVNLLRLEGDAAGKVAIIIDDLVDSGNTVCRAAELLMENGALSAHAYVSHDVLSAEGIQRIQSSVLGSLTLSNSIPLRHRSEKIRYFSVAPLLADAVISLNRYSTSLSTADANHSNPPL